MPAIELARRLLRPIMGDPDRPPKPDEPDDRDSEEGPGVVPDGEDDGA